MKRICCLLDEHRISEGEEAVFVLHRGVVGVHDDLLARKSGDEHDERAFGEVEIGDERIDCFEFITGINEDACVVTHGMYDAVLCGGAFQRSA